MRSRAMRLTLGATVWLSMGAAAFFLIHTERRITEEQSTLRAFEQQVRDVADALTRMRAGQQAYVAEGQGSAFWIPEVASLLDDAGATVTRLRDASVSREADAALEGAAVQVAQFRDADKRAREYLRSGQMLMAGDVIFAEGAASATAAARQIEAAADAERQAADARTAGLRRLEAAALAGTGGLAALVVVLLALAGTKASAQESPLSIAGASADAPAPADPPAHHHLVDDTAPRAAANDAADTLARAAEICTALGRAASMDDLAPLLEQTAAAMRASGVIVWIGDARGADLRPVAAHGYPAQTLARMPGIPRSADNAAAAAYRTGAFQVVSAHGDETTAAVVAPLRSPAGCIGALTTEVARGDETSAITRAMATLVAAQLAAVLAPQGAVTDEAAPAARTATA